MAGQTAAQKAAEEKAAAQKAAEEQAAADKAAAEEQAEAEKAAAEKSAEQAGAAQAPSEQPGGDTEQSEEAEPERDLYEVVGAAVVLRTEDGFERYFYRGAPLDGAAFAQSSIDHAIANGLIAATE